MWNFWRKNKSIQTEEVHGYSISQWLAMTGQEKACIIYWSPVCDIVPGKLLNAPEIPFWNIIYLSKQEAEADVIRLVKDNPNYRFSGAPAIPRSLDSVITNARKENILGVVLRVFNNEKWEDLHKWPVGEPVFTI